MQVGAHVFSHPLENDHAGLPLPATQSFPDQTDPNLARKAVAWLCKPENASLVNDMSTTAFGAWVVWMEASVPSLFRTTSNDVLSIAGAGVFMVGAIRAARNLNSRVHQAHQAAQALSLRLR